MATVDRPLRREVEASQEEWEQRRRSESLRAAQIQVSPDAGSFHSAFGRQ